MRNIAMGCSSITIPASVLRADWISCGAGRLAAVCSSMCVPAGCGWVAITGRAIGFFCLDSAVAPIRRTPLAHGGAAGCFTLVKRRHRGREP